MIFSCYNNVGQYEISVKYYQTIFLLSGILGDAEAPPRGEVFRAGGLPFELRGGGEACRAFCHLEEERIRHNGRRRHHVSGTEWLEVRHVPRFFSVTKFRRILQNGSLRALNYIFPCSIRRKHVC